MKDFEQQFLRHNKDDQFLDPLLYTTKEVRQQILEMQGQAVTSLSMCNAIGLAITAPFQTIITSLQLSVKPHKTIYQQPKAKTTNIAKLNTSLTIQEKRKMQLMIRAGGQNKPYTAPVYDGYIAVIKGLASQGPKAFFKGFFFRSIHQMAHYYCFTEVGFITGNQKGGSEMTNTLRQLGKLYILQCLCDVTFNAFQIAQNRYILQNNIPQFRVFRNGNRVLKKMFARKQVLTGWKYHILNNFGQLFFKIPFLFAIVNHNFNDYLGMLYYLAQVLVYPFNTAFRRLTCQHLQIPGMIPVRYSSINHAVRLIYTEEGILGLYKGFALYHVSTLLKLGTIILTKPLFDQYKDHLKF